MKFHVFYLSLLLYVVQKGHFQTPVEVLDFAMDNPDLCGDVFEDEDWFPETDCTTTCTNSQLCKVNLDDEFKCFDLTSECSDALKEEYGDVKKTTEELEPTPAETTTVATTKTTKATKTTTKTTKAAAVTTKKRNPKTAETEETSETETTTDEPATTASDVDTEATTGDDEGTTTETSESEQTATSDESTQETTTGKTVSPIYPTHKDGEDWHPKCCIWAYKGACGFNPKIMRTRCQKSCGTYGCREKNADQCKVKLKVNPYECPYMNGLIGYIPGYRPKDLSYPIPSPRPLIPPSAWITPSQWINGQNVYCPDKYKRCSYWASIGECTQNPFWMKTRCQKSCKCCGCTVASLAGLSYTPVCDDQVEQCPFWASKGECLSNPTYMNRKCRAACGLC